MKLFSFAAKAALSALVVFGISVSANAGALVEYSFDHSSTHPTTIAPETMASAFNKGVGGDFAGGKFAFAESAAASEVDAPFVTLSLGTLTGKKLEVPVRRILSGVPEERAANRAAMADPAALDFFVEYARTQKDYVL